MREGRRRKVERTRRHNDGEELLRYPRGSMFPTYRPPLMGPAWRDDIALNCVQRESDRGDDVIRHCFCR